MYVSYLGLVYLHSNNIKCYDYKVKIKADLRALTISQNWPARPVHLQREFHF